MTHKTYANKQPTCVHKVEQALAARDDFTLLRTVVEITKLTSHQVSVTLQHLQNYKAAGSLESGGKLWWYLTPGTDTRLRHVEERVPEEKPRAKRVRAKRITLPLEPILVVKEL